MAVFLETAKINSEGRYEIPPLPCLYNLAKRGLQNTINKLNSSNLVLNYNSAFEEWLNEQVIDEVFEEEPAMENVYYLPHRPVVKEGTTPIRPVSYASARSKDQHCLNQCLD